MVLRENGVEAFLRDRSIIAMDSLLGNAIGYVRLQVPQEADRRIPRSPTLGPLRICVSIASSLPYNLKRPQQGSKPLAGGRAKRHHRTRSDQTRPIPEGSQRAHRESHGHPIAASRPVKRSATIQKNIFQPTHFLANSAS